MFGFVEFFLVELHLAPCRVLSLGLIVGGGRVQLCRTFIGEHVGSVQGVG